jgi:hypothetical protein
MPPRAVGARPAGRGGRRGEGRYGPARDEKLLAVADVQSGFTRLSRIARAVEQIGRVGSTPR